MTFATYLKGLRRLYASREVELALSRPATATAIDRLQKKYGYELPSELRNALLTTNGTPGDKPCFARPGFLTSYGFLTIPSALEHRSAMAKRAPQYENYTEPEPRNPRIAPGWYSDGWLPFAEFGGGSQLLMLDCSPAPRGTAGQIIAYTHDLDEISYVASSFERFLAASLKAAQADPDEFLRIY